MKLRTLIEYHTRDNDLKIAAQKNLIIRVSAYSYSEGGRETIEGDDVYIISDIPLISEEQYDKLYQTSFTFNAGTDAGRLESSVDMVPLNLKDDEFGPMSYEQPDAIAKITWKEFVAKMIAEHPDTGDFSE